MKRISLKHISQAKGFTLAEVMMTMAIAAIVLAIGIPSFQTLIKSSRKSTAINDLRTSLALARNTAITQRVRTTVCKSSDGSTCATGGNSGDWSQGWIVFIDPNNPGVRDNNEQILRVHSALSSGSFSGNGTVVNRVSFTAKGIFDNGVGGTLTYSDSHDSNYGGALVISAGGQVHYEDHGVNG